MGLAATSVYAAYTIGAIVCAICAVWLASKGDAGRNDRIPAILALALTANWCIAAASFDSSRAIVGLTEIARNLAWLFVLFRHFANDGRDETVRIVRPAFAVLCLVELLHLLLLFIAQRNAASPQVVGMAFETATTFRLFVAIGALVLVHNLYVGAADASRQLLRWNAAALAGLWAFELNYYTVAYFLGSAPVEMTALRGVAAAFVAVPFALGFARSSAGLEFRPSRAVTFRFLSLLLIGAYLLLMLGIARWLNMASGDLARLVQVGLVIAAGALALIWLPSAGLRGWLRVTAVKHLFKHRYDYRTEWIRFTNTVGRTGFDETSLSERAIKALADITDSPSGLLFACTDEGDLELAAEWQWRKTPLDENRLPAALARLLEQQELIIDFDEVRAGIDHYGECALIPAGLRSDRTIWAAVPLLHFDRLVGLAILSRPGIARKLDWEDFDLLTVVSRQLASYLAEEAGQAALIEAGRFDEFNRRMAFVMHDIKNLSSQMSLLLRNAQKHADKPEFREDMLVTLRNSADKLNSLLARLGRYGSKDKPVSGAFDLAATARRVVDRFRQTHPVALLRAEPALVIGDEEGVEQALIHLVQNAVDASDSESSVVLEIYADGVNGKLQIIDNGKGMSPQFLRNGLFKPFVSSKEGGFGIGAFEARETVRAMGGRLDAESREGIGSRFTLTLPLQATSRFIGLDPTTTRYEDA